MHFFILYKPKINKNLDKNILEVLLKFKASKKLIK